jgi:hypothetical protein
MCLLEAWFLAFRLGHRNGRASSQRRRRPPQRVGDRKSQRPDRRREGDVHEHEPPRKRVSVLHLADDHLRGEHAEQERAEPEDAWCLAPRADQLPADEEEPDAECRGRPDVDVHRVPDLEPESAPGCGPEAVATAPVTTITAHTPTPARATTRSQ